MMQKNEPMKFRFPRIFRTRNKKNLTPTLRHKDDKPKEQKNCKEIACNNASTKQQTNLPHKIDHHIKKGRVLYKNKQYSEAIIEFKTGLQLRESTAAKHDTSSAAVFFVLGNCYYHLEDYDNALVAYRTRIRILRMLSCADIAEPRMDRWIVTALEHKGFSQQDIKDYDAGITSSVQVERLGNSFLEEGKLKQAVLTYRKAVTIEKRWIGNTVTVTYLWKRIAELVNLIDANTEKSTRVGDNGKGQDPPSIVASERSSMTSSSASVQSLNEKTESQRSDSPSCAKSHGQGNCSDAIPLAQELNHVKSSTPAA